MARRYRRFGMLLLVAVVTSHAYGADPPATQSAGIAPSPDALLVSLSKPGWRDRRDAIRELSTLRPDAESMVRELLQRNLDKEQRKNVEVALQLIRDYRELGSSLITLHLKNASAASAMSSLSQQAAGDVPCDPGDLWSHGSWPSVTIDVERQPYWDVLRTLSTRLGVSYIDEAQELVFTRGSPKVADGVSTDGAFIFGANAYTTRRSMVVEILAVGEPKAPVIRTLDLTIQHGVDDAGNQLMSQSGRGGMGRRGAIFGGGRMGWGGAAREGPRIVNAIFQHPQEGVLRIAELTGQITLSVQCGTAVWEINDPMNMSAVTRTVDSIPVTIHELRGADDSYELRASVPYGSDNRMASDEIVDLMRRGLRLMDAEGHMLSMGAPDPQRWSTSTDVTIDFNRGIGKSRQGVPAKIVWEVPDARKVVAPFFFKNLPIDGGF